MPQDAFTLNHIAAELNEKFQGGKISKINQPEKDTLSIIIYTESGSVKLEISASPKYNRVSVGDGEKVNPKTAPNFCMLLRKHLQNAEVIRVQQVGFERIIRFDLKCFSEFTSAEMSLYCEIMGKYSNVILCRDGIILGAMKTTSLDDGAKRLTFSGARYTLPEPQGKANPLNLKELEAAFEKKSGDAQDFIFNNVAGIAYSTAGEIVSVYGEGVTAGDLYSYITSGEIQPCVVYENGKQTDFKVRSQSADKKVYPTLLQAQTAYYSHAIKKRDFDEQARKLTSALNAAIKKVSKRLADIYSGLEECENAETVKLKAELITANIYAVQRGDEALEAVNYYDENGGKIRIALDKRLTPAQNAQKYYKKYAKLKRTLINLTAQRTENEEKKAYLCGILTDVSAAENVYELEEIKDELAALKLIKEQPEKKRKDKPAAPFRKFTKDGFTILAGSNNSSNDRLTKSLAPDDIWLHAQKFHSAHVGIISNGKPVPDGVILAAAQICAYFSEARRNARVPVDYAPKSRVKKPPKANLGFVTYSEYKTIIVAPDAHTEIRNNE